MNGGGGDRKEGTASAWDFGRTDDRPARHRKEGRKELAIIERSELVGRRQSVGLYFEQYARFEIIEAAAYVRTSSQYNDPACAETSHIC